MADQAAIWVPPTVSRDWNAAERLAVIGWITRIAMDRITRDDPTVPLLAKAPVRELMRAIGFITAAHSAVLEDYRAVLLKPYNPARDYNGVEVPPDVLDVLRRRP